MNENDEYKDFLKLFEKSHSSGNDIPEDTSAIHRTQPGHEQRSSTRQGDSCPNSVPRKGSAHLSEYPVRRTQPTRKPGMYLSPKRKAAKKRRQRRMTVIIVIMAVVMFLSVLLIVKSCSGGDKLQGTWDLDSVTVYQFDGNGNGSLNLPGSTYPFTYEIKDNKVSIDFESDAARDITYTFTAEKGKLILKCIEKDREKTYELTKEEAK